LLNNISHDDIAELLGVPAKAYYETYPELAVELQRTMLEYVRNLRAANSTGVVVDAGAGIDAGSENMPDAGSGPLSIKIDSNGFPIAPCPTSLNKTTKDNLEKLYRSYLSLHYRMFIIFMAMLRF
jgi:hypothetical protein